MTSLCIMNQLSYLCLSVSLSLSLSLQASSIRLPVESGTSRLRGFGYAEFGSLQELMDALSLSGEVNTDWCLCVCVCVCLCVFIGLDWRGKEVV